MSFANLFDVAEEELKRVDEKVSDIERRVSALEPKPKQRRQSSKTRNKDEERGCSFCPLNKVPGIKKIKGTIKGRDILVVAQSPGPQENDEGKELLGPAGKFFWTEMRAVGLSRKDVDILSAVKCFPADLVEGSYNSFLKMRSPSKEEIHCCSLYSDQHLKVSPAKQILVLGVIAAKALLKTRSLPQGKTFWSEELQARIYLIDHPAFFIRGYGQGPRMDAFRSTLRRLADDHAGIENTDENLSDQYAFIRQQNYKLVKTKEEAEHADRIIRKYAAMGKRVSVDIEDDEFPTEGHSLHIKTAKIDSSDVSGPSGGHTRKVIGVGICPKPGLSYFFVLNHREQKPKDAACILPIVTALIEDEAIRKAMQYGCTDVTKLRDLMAIHVKGYDHDTNQSEYLRFSDKKAYGLDIIAAQRFPQFAGWKQIVIPEMMEAYKRTLIAEGTKLPAVFNQSLDTQAKYISKVKVYHLRECSLETLRMYNGADCDVTKRIEISNKKHVPQGLMNLYIDLSFLLYEMEPNGPLFDYEQHEKLLTLYPFLEKKLRRRLRKLLGNKEFNPASTDQVYDALYTQLGLEYPFTGKPNTQKMTLLMLGRDHEFPRLILEWRSVSKVKSTYLDGYLRCAQANNGQLRTRWWSCMPAGELVLTNFGYVPVEDVRIGDLVVTHEGRARAVTNAFENGTKRLARVTLANGMSLTTTLNHAYYAADGAWIAARNLCIGDSVLTYGGKEEWACSDRLTGHLVSSWGRVRRIGSSIYRKFQTRDSWGHLTLGVYDASSKSCLRYGVYQLVLDAFEGERPSGYVARHLNGIAWDNVRTNLCWGTQAENRRDSCKHGTSVSNNRITEGIVRIIRSHTLSHIGPSAMARLLGLSRETVCDIRKYRTHRVPIEGSKIVFTPSSVVSIELLPAAMTYGLTVADDCSHVTAGIVTHNTGTRTGRLSSGGEKNKKDSTIVNLQNIKKDPHMRNMCVADLRWRRVFDFIQHQIDKCPEVVEYWARAKQDKKAECSELVTEQLSWLSKRIVIWIEKHIPDLYTYLILDYGQVEVRVAAQMSGDKNLMKDCMQADIHTTVGVTMTGWDPERIKNDEATRTLTKNVHFGILFRISKANLFKFVVAMSPMDMRDRISESQVNEAYDRYFARYSKIRELHERLEAEAVETGAVKTMFGMIQTLNVTPDGDDDDEEYVDFSEMDARKSNWRNQSANGPVQGTAHQILICAMVNLIRKREQYKILGIPVMEVHDAGYWRVKVLELLEAYKLAKYLMEHESLNTVKEDFPDIKWKVPIVVDAKAGLRLGSGVGITEKTTVGDFMLDWWRKTYEQITDLDKQLEQVVTA